MSFDNLGLSPVIKHNLHGLEYRVPTPVQAKAIPLALEGRDVIGSAQTGTGKTAACGLPMIERLVLRANTTPLKPGQPRALLLTPTRELALQVTAIRHSFFAARRAVQTAFAGIARQRAFAPRQFMETKARAQELRLFAISSPAKPTSWWPRTSQPAVSISSNFRW
jgi:DEAD/DEAH box helicase